MNKLNMETKNIVNENIIKIRSLFPNVVFETKKGLEVDFDLLKLELKNNIIKDTKRAII